MYMYKEDVALNKLQLIICYKTKLNLSKVLVMLELW